MTRFFLAEASVGLNHIYIPIENGCEMLSFSYDSTFTAISTIHAFVLTEGITAGWKQGNVWPNYYIFGVFVLCSSCMDKNIFIKSELYHQIYISVIFWVNKAALISLLAQNTLSNLFPLDQNLKVKMFTEIGFLVV